MVSTARSVIRSVSIAGGAAVRARMTRYMTEAKEGRLTERQEIL